MAVYTAKHAKSGEVLKYTRYSGSGRNRVKESAAAAFGDDEPNGFALAVQACAQNGGGIVESNTPLANGESKWCVEGDGSYKPVVD